MSELEKENSLKIFEDKNVRVQWNAKQEKWYFSVVDIVSVLTDNDYQNARTYWSVLKVRLKEEGGQLATNCSQLKMKAYDGKMRDTDVMDTEQILRLVQSIPSKKAEPFKLWLARVGSERIDETYDPEIAKKTNPKGMKETRETVVDGATVAKNARKEIERKTGEKIVSSKNAREIKNFDTNDMKILRGDL